MKDVDREDRCTQVKICFDILGENMVCFYVRGVAECDGRHVGRQTPCRSGEGKNVGGVSQSQQVLEHVILPSDDSFVARRGCAENRVR